MRRQLTAIIEHRHLSDVRRPAGCSELKYANLARHIRFAYMIERNRKAEGARLPDGNSAAKPMQLTLAIESNAHRHERAPDGVARHRTCCPFDRVFRQDRDVLAYFGSDIMDGVR